MLDLTHIRNLSFPILIILLSPAFAICSNDSKAIEFFKSGITFGFNWDGTLFCDPEYVDPEYKPENDDFLKKYLKDNTPKGTLIIDYGLVDLSAVYIKESMKDSPGDTVQIIHSKGKFYAVVEKVSYLIGECYQGIVCVLKPVDKKYDIRRVGHDFVVLRKNKFYSGTTTPFQQFEVSDPSYSAIVDSAVNKMARAAMDYKDGKLGRINKIKKGVAYQHWMEDRGNSSYPFPFIIINSKAFGPRADIRPDTLMAAVRAVLVDNTWYGWVSLLEIYRRGDSWEAKTILEPHPGRQFNMICSLDINGDSVPEYFVFTWDGALYTYIDGMLELVAYANYRGC